MPSQKSIVVDIIRNTFNDLSIPLDNVLESINKNDDLKNELFKRLLDKYHSGSFKIKKETITSNPKKLKDYMHNVINNWARKAKEFNKEEYIPQEKRVLSRDKVLRELYKVGKLFVNTPKFESILEAIRERRSDLDKKVK